MCFLLGISLGNTPLVYFRHILRANMDDLQFLLQNPDKTELIVQGHIHHRDTLSNDIATLNGITLASSTTIRKLGVIFDQDLYFNFHIKLFLRAAFFHLRNTAKICQNILSQKDAETYVYVFVT